MSGVMILGVNIRNFDVFEDAAIGLMMEDSYKYAGCPAGQQGIRLMNLNALIGRNNTGKSSFIRALSFVKRCILTDAGTASISDGRPGFSNLLMDRKSPAQFRLFFRIRDQKTGRSAFLQYEISVGMNSTGSPFILREAVLESVRSAKDEGKAEIREILVNSQDQRIVTDDKVTALGIYGRIAAGEYKEIRQLYEEISGWFFCAFSAQDSSDYYSSGNAPGAHRHLNSDGSNVGNVLEYIKSMGEDGYNSLMNDIKSRIPEMKKKRSLPVNLEGSPEKLFKYLLLLRDPKPRTTIFIETPDRDLYHDMVDVLADEMRDFTLSHPYSQIIFSTHNPYIIETMSPREIWVFSRGFNEETDEDDNVSVSCAGEDPVVTALFEEGVGMGAIWYGGHLDQGSSEYDDEGVSNAH